MNLYIKRLFKGMIMSFSMFSTIPVPSIWEESSLCYIIPMFPIVGIVIGGLSYFVNLFLLWTNLPLMLTVPAAMLFSLFVTGFIHIDGYMDTCDAIFSRGSLEKMRNILKDSHVGAFAVIALIVFMLLMFCGTYTIMERTVQLLPFLWIPVLSRCISGLTLLNVKLISEQGFGASFQKNTKPLYSVFLALMAGICVICMGAFGGFRLVLVLAVEALAGFLCGIYTVKQLDGISGDLCGFILTASELSGILAWAVILCY